MKLTVASFNIYKKLSPERTKDDFEDALSISGLDVIGLQEIDWEIKDSNLLSGWKYYQPDVNAARKDPILWYGQYARDHGSIKVLDPVLKDETTTPTRYANWVVFEDFIWINFHLNADVEGRPGVPKPKSPRPMANFLMLKRIIDLADYLQEQYRVPVFLSADMNVDFGADRRVRHMIFPYATLTRAGFKCCWEGRVEESTRTGKPRGRTIDQIWARGSKTYKVRFLDAWTPNRWRAGDPVESDHLAVVAKVAIRKRVAPWLYTVLGKRK